MANHVPLYVYLIVRLFSLLSRATELFFFFFEMRNFINQIKKAEKALQQRRVAKAQKYIAYVGSGNRIECGNRGEVPFQI